MSKSRGVTCIERLNGVRLSDWLEMSSGLMPNSRLRKVHIYLDYYCSEDMVSRARASLQKMTNLVKLHLNIDTMGKHGYEPCDKLLSMIPNLESLTSLTLKSYGLTYDCPAASVFPPNLTHLTLARIQDLTIKELGKLPKLQYLALEYSFVSVHMERMKILHGEFPCLKALSLEYIYGLAGIDVEEGGMPCFKQLRIRLCPDLKSTENLPKHIIISFA